MSKQEIVISEVLRQIEQDLQDSQSNVSKHLLTFERFALLHTTVSCSG